MYTRLQVKRIAIVFMIALLTSACGAGLQTQRITPTIQPTPEKTRVPTQAPASQKITPTDSTSLPAEPAILSASPTPVQPQMGFPDTNQYQWSLIASGFEKPVGLAHAGDGQGRLFVVEQAGVIRIIRNNQVVDTPFLDLRDRVGSSGNEQGLLGLAFHPSYRQNGQFFINYTDSMGDTVIARFQVSKDNPDQADVTSEKVLLKVSQPFANHNGGALAFGHDGYLYLGLGDGGSAGDPQNNAQSLQTMLGKILRLDVDNGETYTTPNNNIFAEGQLPEIWAYGLRNPWRFSFDRQTGDLFIGDVGQNQWEEINFLPAGSQAGINLGWKYFEGTHLFTSEPPDSNLPLTPPIVEYNHSAGCSVTGGVIYRGAALQEWNGIYLYGDYCTGWIRGIYKDQQGLWQQSQLFENIGRIVSFGEDESGEVYVVDHNGQILKLEARRPTSNLYLPNTMNTTSAEPIKNLSNAPRYDIYLTINPTTKTFEGTSRVNLTNTEDVALDQIYFRLLPNGGKSYGDGSLTVSRTTIAGQPIRTNLSPDNTTLEVFLSSPLQPGEQVQIDLAFQGNVPQDYGALDTGYGIYNFSENVMALSGWYPILAVYDQDGWNLDLPSAIGDSVYSETAFYTVNLTVPTDQVVAASGVEINRIVEGKQANITLASGPVRDFFIILSPDFNKISKNTNGTRVNSFYLPGRLEGAEKALEIAASSLNTYNQRFGPYPYAELDIVDAPMQNAAGVEFPGIILVADNLYLNHERPTFTIAAAHEVAHQWWYNVVGNDIFDDPWLDEALTTYSSSLYFEDNQLTDGLEGLISGWQRTYDGLVNSGYDDQVTRSLGYFESLSRPDIYGAVVYVKGALFFHQLRQLIGDAAFFQALQNYYHDFQFEIADPQDLLTAFETASGRSLDDFYQEWLYSKQ